MSEQQDRLDEATRRRLARLATRPVDAAALERKLAAELNGAMNVDGTAPVATNEPVLRSAVGRPSARRRWLDRWPAWGTAVAAMLAVVLTVLFTLGPDSHVDAAPHQMLQMHRAMTTGRGELVAARDTDAVRAMLAAGWSGEHELPPLPEYLTASCCLTPMDGRPLLGMLLDHRGTLVTVVVADARGSHVHGGETVRRDGHSFQWHELDGIGMLMTTVGDRAICFMGDLPRSELLTLASQCLTTASR